MDSRNCVACAGLVASCQILREDDEWIQVCETLVKRAPVLMHPQCVAKPIKHPLRLMDRPANPIKPKNMSRKQ